MRRLWQQAAGGWTRRPTRWSSPTWRSAAQSCTPSTAVRSSRGERHNVDFVTQRECSPCAHAHVGYLRMSHIFKPFCVKLIESELASSFLQRQRQGVHRGAGIGHHCHARVIGVATAVCSNRAAFAKPPSCPSASIRLQSVSSVLTQPLLQTPRNALARCCHVTAVSREHLSIPDLRHSHTLSCLQCAASYRR